MTHAARALLCAAAALGAVDAQTTTSVYLGSGCFWHTQYDFYVVERNATGAFQRTDAEVTSKIGYAGGFDEGAGGRVCYHNSQNIAGSDYNHPLNHAEATEVLLDDGPLRDQQWEEILLSFWHEFEVKDSATPQFTSNAAGQIAQVPRVQRLDPQDEGAAYRPNIGIPGGVNGELYPLLVASNARHKQIPLVEGHAMSARGTPNTDTSEFGVSEVIYIYDTNVFPFYRGEQYHQYHPNIVIQRVVPQSYLVTARNTQAQLGLIDPTGCVDQVVDVLRSPTAQACYAGAPMCVGRYLAVTPSCMCSADCVIGVEDLLLLLGAFGGAPNSITVIAGDIDGDGATDVADLLLLLGAFGRAC